MTNPRKLYECWCRYSVLVLSRSPGAAEVHNPDFRHHTKLRKVKQQCNVASRVGLRGVGFAALRIRLVRHPDQLAGPLALATGPGSSLVTLASALLGACEALLTPFGTRSTHFAAIPSTWRSKMGRLKCRSPVPSDIDIAQACKPVHIEKIAKDLGLCPEDYDLHGTTKAKVCRAAPLRTPPLQWRARPPMMTRDLTSQAGRRSSSPYWIRCRGSPMACTVSAAACTGPTSSHDPTAPRVAWQPRNASRCSRPNRLMRDTMARSGGGGYQPDAPGRGQEHHHCGAEPGSGRPPGALRGHLHPPALSGVRCCRWFRPPSRVSVQCPFQGGCGAP